MHSISAEVASRYARSAVSIFIPSCPRMVLAAGRGQSPPPSGGANSPPRWILHAPPSRHRPTPAAQQQSREKGKGDTSKGVCAVFCVKIQLRCYTQCDIWDRCMYLWRRHNTLDTVYQVIIQGCTGTSSAGSMPFRGEKGGRCSHNIET